nr:MAG TPA: hypothetical protein [Caudoviricetes sp.]
MIPLSFFAFTMSYCLLPNLRGNFLGYYHYTTFL